MSISQSWWRYLCRRKGHDWFWFPGLGRQEFVPSSKICMRCGKLQPLVPWGECLVGSDGHRDPLIARHGLAAHYALDPDDPLRLIVVPYGRCPRPV